MKNIVVYILDSDSSYVKAFVNTVALDHAGYAIGTRSACGDDCRKDADVCLRFEGDKGDGKGACGKAFQPVCGKYAGVNAILKEARAFVLDNLEAGGKGGNGARGGGAARYMDEAVFPAGALLCVYSCSGGAGTSTAAIGVARELARYRDERVLYLSLEDVEDPGLLPAGIEAMRAEEVLYRYLRLLNGMAGREAFEKLFSSAAVRDDYGLYRIAPDDGPGSLSVLAPGELCIFLAHFVSALRLSRVVLDFGTRLRGLEAFAKVLESRDAIFIEAIPAEETGLRKRKECAGGQEHSVSAVFTRCEEDIRTADGKTNISLKNAFGLAVKEVCDRIVEETL